MGRPWLFEIGAFLYGVMTAQKTWRDSCASLADYYPTAGVSRGPLVLDLGCGPGVSSIILAKKLPEARVIGVDLAPRMLVEARSYTKAAGLENRVAYVLADAAALPFAASTFALITGHSFLYLVNDREKVAQEAFRAVQREGAFASMEPRQGHVDWSVVFRHWREIRYLVSVVLWRPYSRWHGQLSNEKFRDLMGKAGFRKTNTQQVLDGLGIIGSGIKP